MGDSENTTDFEASIRSFRDDYTAIVEQIGRVIVGHEQAIHEVLACLLSGGHVLLEGVPGLG